MITEWQYRNVMIEMSALGYRTQEPGDIEREQPCWIFNLVARLHQDQGYDVSEIADLVGLWPDEFQALYQAGDAGTQHEVNQ